MKILDPKPTDDIEEQVVNFSGDSLQIEYAEDGQSTYHAFSYTEAGNTFYLGSTDDFQEAILFLGKRYAEEYGLDWDVS